MDEPQSISAVGMYFFATFMEALLYLPFLTLYAVQSIMETLSDAVNQLILLVIALQEANAAMPAHIPPAAVCHPSYIYFTRWCIAFS